VLGLFDPNSAYAPATSPPNAAVKTIASSHVGSASPREGGGAGWSHDGLGSGAGGGGGGAYTGCGGAAYCCGGGGGGA
jgi:hypothetical protein